jgi:exodeoxyribonuclease V gamma subunit
LDLFENSSFRQKQGWDLERLDQIRSWIGDAKVRWGRDREQRKSVMSEILGEETEAGLRGTWEEGADRIVNGMVYLFPEEWVDSPQPSPIGGVGLGEADEVEELLSLIDELQRDLAPLSGRRNMAGWAEILQGLSEKYLSGEDVAALDEIFYSMRHAGENIDSDFPFLAHLFDRKEEGSVGVSALHAVRFASLEEGSILPCRALFLIGQDEASFPRKNGASSLDLLRGGKEAPPATSEKDRYLFLQAICSARDLIAISYGHISAEDGKEIGPSILVQELQSYLKKKVPVLVHPNFALHARCFQSPECQSMSQKSYRAAEVFYGHKEPLKLWAPFNLRPELEMPKGERVVTVRDLASLFRHPWKFYLSKTLHLRIEEEEKKDWEDFEVDFIKRSQIFRSSLQQPLESVIDRLDQKGSFPVGLFGKMARMNLVETLGEWKENLAGFGVDTVKTLRLRDLASGEFDFPPLELEWENLKVKIV